MKQVRGAFKLINVTKYRKSPKGGEGSTQKIKKFKIGNLDFLIRGGGKAILPSSAQLKLGSRYKLAWTDNSASCDWS